MATPARKTRTATDKLSPAPGKPRSVTATAKSDAKTVTNTGAKTDGKTDAKTDGKTDAKTDDATKTADARSQPTTASGEARAANAASAAETVDLRHAADDPHIFDDPVTTRETLETTSEQLDMLGEFVRRCAESSLAHSRQTLDGLRNSADRAAVNFEQSTIAWQEAGRDLNVRTISAIKAGTDDVFDYMVALAGARSWQDAAALCNEHAQRQFAQMRERQRELAEACGDFARKSMEPLRAQD